MVSSSRYSFHDGSAPASGTLCLSHGGRKSRHSSLCRLSQRCGRQLRRPRRGRDTSIGGWRWVSKGGSGYAQSSVLLSQLPQGLLNLAHRLRTVATGSGSEIPPKLDEQLVSIKRRVAVNICLGRYPVVARRSLASYTPRLAELQVEGGNAGPNVGSAATPPSRLSTPSGAAAQLRCGAGFSEPVQR